MAEKHQTAYYEDGDETEQDEIERQKDLIMEKLVQIEDRTDVGELPDVDVLLEDLNKYMNTYPELEDLHEDLQKLQKLIERQRNSKKAVKEDGTGKVPDSRKDLRKSGDSKAKKRVQDALSKINYEEWNATGMQKVLEVRQMAEDLEDVDDDYKMSVIKQMDKQWEWILNRQQIYLFVYRSQEYRDIRDEVLEIVEEMAREVVEKTKIRGQESLKIVEPITKETFVCYVDTEKPKRQFCIEYADFTQESADHKKGIELVTKEVEGYELLLVSKLPTVAEMIAPDFSLDELRAQYSPIHGELFDKLKINLDFLVSYTPTYEAVPGFPHVSKKVASQRQIQAAAELKTLLDAGETDFDKIERKKLEAKQLRESFAAKISKKKRQIMEKLAEIRYRKQIEELDVDVIAGDFERNLRKNPKLEKLRGDFRELAELIAERDESQKPKPGEGMDIGQYYQTPRIQAVRNLEELLKDFDRDADAAGKERQLLELRQSVRQSKEISEEVREEELRALNEVISQFRTELLVELMWSSESMEAITADMPQFISRYPLLQKISDRYSKAIAKAAPNLMEDIAESELPVAEIWDDVRRRGGDKLMKKREKFVNLLNTLKRAEMDAEHDENARTILTYHEHGMMPPVTAIESATNNNLFISTSVVAVLLAFIILCIFKRRR